jgi:hypothetical protein
MRIPPAALALLLALGGCANPGGGAPGPGGEASGAPEPTPAAGSAALVLRVQRLGGFVPAAALGRVPTVSVYADGSVITPGPPGTGVATAKVVRIPPDAVRTLVGKATDAGVRTGLDLGTPPVYDAPTTRITVVTGAGTQRVDAVALTEVPPTAAAFTAAQRAARTKLVTLVNELSDLPATLGADQVGPAQPYAPTALAAIAMPLNTPRRAADGGTATGPTAPAWPGPPLLDRTDAGPSNCTTITGPDVPKVLAATAARGGSTAWTYHRQTWSVTIRPLLPDEHGCADLRMPPAATVD